MGWLMKIGFPCNTLAVHLGSMPYVYRVMMGRTSGHNTVRLL